MMIVEINGLSKVYFCGNYKDHFRKISKRKAKKTIPTYFSFKEAKREGWLFTKDNNWCEPGQEYAAVCPECVKKYF